MSERPWLKWYPSDWRADPRLRTCSLTARGLWTEMICLMHEAEPYGSLLVNAAPVSEKQLASLVGASAREVRNCLHELEAAGVFSVDNGVMFSRRMRRDHEKAERDKANGKGGGNPRLKHGVNPEDKAQRLEARNQKLEPDQERSDGSLRSPVARADANRDAFDEFWKLYPNKVGKQAAYKAFVKSAKSGAVTFDRMLFALTAYVNKTDDRPWCNPATWLNEGRWDDQPTPEVQRNGQGNVIAAADKLVAKFRQLRSESEHGTPDLLSGTGAADVRLLPPRRGE